MYIVKGIGQKELSARLESDHQDLQANIITFDILHNQNYFYSSIVYLTMIKIALETCIWLKLHTAGIHRYASKYRYLN